MLLYAHRDVRTIIRGKEPSMATSTFTQLLSGSEGCTAAGTELSLKGCGSSALPCDFVPQS